MKAMGKKKLSLPLQYLISLALIAFISITCFATSHFIGYKVVALLLLLAVSLLAMVFDIVPVLTMALLSALVWNFFFIPPLFTFHIANAEDALMFLMYFVVAMVNAVLTFKIRQAEKKARDREEKENTIKLYNTLLNSLSHELRTPISAIIGAVDTLKENKEQLSSVNQAELLHQISTASIRLNREVDNLLNMSRVETGTLKLRYDWCDANELVHNILRKFVDDKGNRSITYTTDEELPLFKMDVTLIEQALYNIVHNAIQYTPEGSNITINVSLKADDCIITVSDNGKGFPESELSFVFNKFYRLPGSKTGGLGLGLSIAKGFIMAHGGTIITENNETGGAKFTLVIPAERSFITNLKNE